jgi:hypothetical protein
MTPDWSALAPHRPLDPGSELYAAPPNSAAEEIAARVRAGGQTILVGGPAGIGKSTELARAASLLYDAGDRLALYVSIDRWENMRRLTRDSLLLRLAGAVAWVASQGLGLTLSHDLLGALVRRKVLPLHVLSEPLIASYVDSPEGLVQNALEEVTRVGGRPLTLLLDGLEKVPEAPGSLELFDALGELPEHVDLVVVVPWHVTYGPHAETVIRPGEHWTIMSPGQVAGPEGNGTRGFLKAVLVRRLARDADHEVVSFEDGTNRITMNMPAAVLPLLEEAAVLSGGIPRLFLQLVAEAGTYARLHRGDEWPTEEDLADAVADLEDSFRRALLPGDTEAALAAEGTDGRELELSRRIRLLARGILLERRQDKRVYLEVHPLARRPLTDGSPRA